MNVNRPHFLWEKTIVGRPQPVKVPCVDFGVNGWKRSNIIAYHELSGELAKLPIAELEKLFPCPASREETAQ
ncbi:MAG TPA: hypothetical protein VH678_11205 [Xanthobacteraceae bacterium]|jgi:hypothetical protein